MEWAPTGNCATVAEANTPSHENNLLYSIIELWMKREEKGQVGQRASSGDGDL